MSSEISSHRHRPSANRVAQSCQKVCWATADFTLCIDCTTSDILPTDSYALQCVYSLYATARDIGETGIVVFRATIMRGENVIICIVVSSSQAQLLRLLVVLPVVYRPSAQTPDVVFPWLSSDLLTRHSIMNAHLISRFCTTVTLLSISLTRAFRRRALHGQSSKPQAHTLVFFLAKRNQ